MHSLQNIEELIWLPGTKYQANKHSKVLVILYKLRSKSDAPEFSKDSQLLVSMVSFWLEKEKENRFVSNDS